MNRFARFEFGLLALAFACSSAEEQAAQRSAARVARAIEVLRSAPNSAKSKPLATLAKLGCTGADVCKTRDACSSAYAEHIEALTLTAAAKQKFNDGDNLEAAKLLNASEQMLAASSAKVTACIDAEGSLRRRHKL